MSRDWLRYDVLVQDALRGVVRTVLTRVAKEGLPGNHHFFISFRTNFPGVEMSDDLRARYPEEMTIVIQHQFFDLSADEKGFSIGLSFNKMPQTLRIPYAAMTMFHDPAVQFQLPFQTVAPAGAAYAPAKRESPVERMLAQRKEPAPAEPRAPGSASIVSLDNFRKK